MRKFSFYYKETPALQDVNLEIPANETFAIFGPANSGTTTFLRTLNRLTDLIEGTRFDGEILLGGKNIYSPETDVRQLRQKVGMVFENPTPLPISIFENVAYGPRLTGVRDKKKLEQVVEESLRMAVLWDEVKDRLHTPAVRLSGGQQQRLCIARVLALSPEVILLDRPCSGLDPISTAKVEDSLQQLKERCTIIIAAHNVQQAGRVGDRAAFFLMGRVVEYGPTKDVFLNPKDQRTNDYVTGKFG